jgi:hypothetical protein
LIQEWRGTVDFCCPQQDPLVPFIEARRLLLQGLNLEQEGGRFDLSAREEGLDLIDESSDE